MAHIIRPAITDPSNYRGLDWIFEYTNQDGALTTWNCGQAAAATFLTHHGAMDPVQAAKTEMKTRPVNNTTRYFCCFRKAFPPSNPMVAARPSNQEKTEDRINPSKAPKFNNLPPAL